jgi:hypothetical protein
MTARLQVALLPEEVALQGTAKAQIAERANDGFLRRAREGLIAYLEQTGRSQADVAKAMGLSAGTISLFLRDGYQASGVNPAKRIVAFLDLEARRGIAPQDAMWVQTQAAKDVLTVLAQCHELRDFGMIYGAAGIGKTRAAERYQKLHPDCILLRCTESIRQRRPFLRALAMIENVKAPTSGAMDALFEGVKSRLKNSGRLLIVDEAQKLDFRTVELIRDLYDLTGIGVVLMGDELIYQMLQMGRTRAQYERLASRIGIRRCLQPGPEKCDVEAIARQYIEGPDEECIAYLTAKALGVGGYRAVVKHCRLAFRAAAADGGRGVTREDLEAASELLG